MKPSIRSFVTKTLRSFVSLGVLIGLLSGCDTEPPVVRPQYGVTPPQSEIEYRFSIHPLHNPTRLAEVFGPLIDLLNRHIRGVRFQLESSRDYASYNEKLFQGQHDFSLPNPYQTLRALDHGYRVFGKMGDDESFRGIILVRRDSSIREIAELKGQAVSFPAPTALAATMMPQYYLKQQGVDPLRDIEVRYVGSQESSIMNVFHGDTAAGATWPPPWRAFARERPEAAAQLEVRWQTDPLPNNGVIANRRVPDEHVNAVARILFNLHESEEGRSVLARMDLSRFEPANANTYRPVRRFVRAFAREVRDPDAEP